MIKKVFKILSRVLLTACVVPLLFSCANKNITQKNILSNSKATTIEYAEQIDSENAIDENKNSAKQKYEIDKDGTYTNKEEVALYIYTYKKLPKNFITKNEAKKLGWVPSKNNLGKVAKGMSIGGDVFGNYEKILPIIDGRKYYECDIDFDGKKRNGKRIVYADDFNGDIGFIYYTDDHYKTFERLY